LDLVLFRSPVNPRELCTTLFLFPFLLQQLPVSSSEAHVFVAFPPPFSRIKPGFSNPLSLDFFARLPAAPPPWLMSLVNDSYLIFLMRRTFLSFFLSTNSPGCRLIFFRSPAYKARPPPFSEFQPVRAAQQTVALYVTRNTFHPLIKLPFDRCVSFVRSRSHKSAALF